MPTKYIWFIITKWPCRLLGLPLDENSKVKYWFSFFFFSFFQFASQTRSTTLKSSIKSLEDMELQNLQLLICYNTDVSSLTSKWGNSVSTHLSHLHASRTKGKDFVLKAVTSLIRAGALEVLTSNFPLALASPVDTAVFCRAADRAQLLPLTLLPEQNDSGSVAALGSLFSDRFPMYSSSIVFSVRVIVCLFSLLFC